MRFHRCLVPLLIAVAMEATVATAMASEPELAPRPDAMVASPDAAIDAKNDNTPQGNTSELHGTYNFLLEVGGITPAEPAQERKRSASPSRSHDPRAAGQTIDSTD